MSIKKKNSEKEFCFNCREQVSNMELESVDSEITLLTEEKRNILIDNLASLPKEKDEEEERKFNHYSKNYDQTFKNVCYDCLKYLLLDKFCYSCHQSIELNEFMKTDEILKKLSNKEPKKYNLFIDKIDELEKQNDVRYFHNIKKNKNICKKCYKLHLYNIELELKMKENEYKDLQKIYSSCVRQYEQDFQAHIIPKNYILTNNEIININEIRELDRLSAKNKSLIIISKKICDYSLSVSKKEYQDIQNEQDKKQYYEKNIVKIMKIQDIIAGLILEAKEEEDLIAKIKKMKIGDTIYLRADRTIERADENIYTYNDQGLYFRDFDLENLIKFINGENYKALKEYDYEEYMKEEENPPKSQFKLDKIFIKDLQLTPQEFKESLEKWAQENEEEEPEEVSEEKGDFKLEDVKDLYLKPTNNYGLEIPEFLKPFTREKFPPADEFIIQTNNGNYIRVSMYGKYKGSKFERKHITKENIKRICCIHDASHSVALFLQEKDKCDCAIHNRLPLQFPYNDEYILYYTQKYEYPLIMTTLLLPMDYLLKKNGLITQFRRWCTRTWKIETPRNFYKYFNLNGITQVKGITKHQSAKRSVMNPNPSLDAMSQKTFEVYQELPIFEMKDEEIKQLIKDNEIEFNPMENKFDSHGCIACPFRNCEYYQNLKKNYPKMYKQIDEWRIMASKEGKEYYWFYNPGSPISNLLKQLTKLRKSGSKETEKIEKKEAELEKIVRKSPDFLAEYSIKKAIYDENSKEYKVIRDLALIDEENRRSSDFMEKKATKSPCDFTKDESGKLRPIMRI